MRWWILGVVGLVACSAGRGASEVVADAAADIVGDAFSETGGDTTFDEILDSGSAEVADVGDTGSTRAMEERCEDAPDFTGANGGCLDTATIDFADPRFDCFVCGLWACRDITGGFFQGLGSTFVSSVRYATDMCYYRLTAEVEGGVTVYDCANYPGFAPWPELLNPNVFPDPASGRAYCTVVTTCSVLDPERPCGTDVLGCGL